MNRAAVKKGCVTAKDFVQHCQTDRIYTYVRDPPKAPPKIDLTQAFGQKPSRVQARVQPSMADLITAKFNDAMFDEEGEYPKVTAKNLGNNAVINNGASSRAPFSTSPAKS